MTQKSQKQSDSIVVNEGGEYTGDGENILRVKIGEDKSGFNTVDNRSQVRVIQIEEGRYVFEYNDPNIVNYTISNDKPQIGEVFDPLFDAIEFNMDDDTEMAEIVDVEVNQEYDNIVEQFEEIYN